MIFEINETLKVNFASWLETYHLNFTFIEGKNFSLEINSTTKNVVFFFFFFLDLSVTTFILHWNLNKLVSNHMFIH